MQAISVNMLPALYDSAMQIGRPAKNPRTEFGQHLFDARTQAGLSQAQVAELLGITQTAYADWERYPVALRPDQIHTLTEILSVSVEQLYGQTKPKASGPIGKARRLFEEVSRLPRKQQQPILTTVEDMLLARRTKAAA
jgi:transcriptional regulator with XRE-family HTH domain